MTQPYGEPWYAPTRKKQGTSGDSQGAAGAGAQGTQSGTGSGSSAAGGSGSSRGGSGGLSVMRLLLRVWNGVVALLLALAGGACVGFAFAASTGAGTSALLVVGGIALLAAAFYFLLRQMGDVFASLSEVHAKENPVTLALGVMRGDLRVEESRKGMPAPEMALLQFVQQVRAYATEKSYQKNRLDLGPTAAGHTPLVAEPVDLLKRRWNEVLDSMGEFEIYLANDPQGMITKLISKHPNLVMDVSQVFRDVAESFDNTWRRKGINIEAAIVTPLRANTNEALLRRLLVGPWRSSAYFARRGGGVLFSAKSKEGKVVARWECEGLSIPEDYLAFARQSSIPVNERIERGLTVLAPDPNSPNTLHALISFITWIDLAQTVGADFAFKHTNDGFVIELRLK